jgi:murein DD-endopeptidase MepM/ murein hydrolase activator NlpD
LADVKTVLASTTALLLGVATLPAVLANGDPPPLVACGIAGPVEAVLATIREVESGHDYRAQSPGSSASGAYQFLDSTWDGYGDYTHAKDAPPAVQDAKATELASSILERHRGDVAAVPVVWYLGHLPEPGSPRWDTVPVPSAGNRLTPRQYQARWMAAYERLLAETTGTTPDTTAACENPGGAVAPIDGEWSLPGPRALIDANPGALDGPHHDYPAWDWLVPGGTPIYAVRGGTVVTVRNWPFNWWSRGCGRRGERSCDSCGVGVTIVDDGGTRWTYCHGSALTTMLGATVDAGEQVLWSGDTGRSGAPHLHLEIRVDGQRRCPQPLVTSLYQRGVGISARSLPGAGCSY